MKLVVCHNEYDAQQKAAEFLNRELTISNEKPVLFLTSGGSSLSLLSHIKSSSIGPGLTVGVTDERYSVSVEANNFLQLKSTVFAQVVLDQGGRLLETVPAVEESLNDFAARYETALREWVSDYPGGKIVATLGIGADGHTVGILPFPESPALFEGLFIATDQWVVGYDVKNKSPHRFRVSITWPFMTQINASLSYATGQAKRGALIRSYYAQGSVAETPGILVRRLDHTMFFTDNDLNLPA